jgi:phosphatidylglycerophosphate synthase
MNGYLFLAALSLNLLYLFDNLDGQWARIKNMTSSFGAMFDSLVDGWNISIIIFAIGEYLYTQPGDIGYLNLTIFFFLLSFLDFAFEKNNLLENKDEKDSIDMLSLQERNTNLKPFILIISAITMYDKWVLMITIGLIFNILYLSLIYIIAVRLLNYSVKLFKLYLKFR